MTELPNLNIVSILLPCFLFLFTAAGVSILSIYLLNKRKKEMVEQFSHPEREVPPGSSQLSEMKVCNSCGAENPPENNFCEQCGTTLGK